MFDMPALDAKVGDQLMTKLKESHQVRSDAAVPSDGLHARILHQRQSRRRAQKRTIWVIRLSVVVGVLGIWEFLARREIISPQLISMPSDVWKAFGFYFSEGTIWSDIWATSMASAIGLLVGAGLGIFSGVILGKSEMLATAFAPFVTTLNALPRVALAPIFLVWFGLGVTPKVLVAASIVYFVLLVNTMAGLRNVDADIAFLSTALAMSRLQRFRLVDFPSALPAVTAGLRLGAVYSVLGVIVSEMVASQAGLGQVLVAATSNLRMDRAFAVIAIITAVATALDLLISFVDNRVRRSHVVER